MPARIKTAPKVFGTATLVKGNCLLFREIRLKLLGIGEDSDVPGADRNNT